MQRRPHSPWSSWGSPWGSRRLGPLHHTAIARPGTRG